MSRIKDHKRILIVRMDRIGDVVLSTPVIKAVRDEYPDSYIAVLVRPYARDIINGNPYVNEVITYDKSGRQRGILGNVRFISSLRRKRFDLVIILHPKNSSHVLAFLAGIPERIGYDKKLGVLLTKRIPHKKQYGLKHEMDYTLDVLNYAGIKAKDKSLYMPINKLSEEKIRGIFNKNGILERDIVITVHPAASCPSRRWALDRFAKIADILSEKFGAKLIIVAGTADAVFGRNVSALMKFKPLDLSGKTSIADLASILKRSKLLISNDSGPVHIACALGIPVISIFSRKDRGISPQRWAPLGKDCVALHRDVGCEICLAHNCKLDFKCLDAISVEDVLLAAERILEPKN